MNIEEFIHLGNDINKNKYDYSEFEYTNIKTKGIIICPIHGKFLQDPHHHIYRKQGCSKCSGNYKSNSQEFIYKAIQINGDRYDYSRVKYINAHTNVIIICRIHGDFLQKPNHHLSRGGGCYRCYLIEKFDTREVFINKSNISHNFKYDYSLSDYKNSITKVVIICPKHGEFKQRPVNHIKGRGCSDCNSSKGEDSIENFLKCNNIQYEKEFIFDICRGTINSKYPKGKPLPFDFYVPKYNTCIEFDGPHHFKPVRFTSDMKIEDAIKVCESTKKNDKIKNKFCKENNIKILRIHYLKINYIEKILLRELV